MAKPKLRQAHTALQLFVSLIFTCFGALIVDLVERVDKQAIINRLLNPLVQPSHKLQQEANGNVALKQSLNRLAITLQSAEVGIHAMGIGLQMQY